MDLIQLIFIGLIAWVVGGMIHKRIKANMIMLLKI